MNDNKRVRVAITHGDTNGIGYELIFKTFAEPEMLELCTPIIYGSPKVATYHRNALGIEANFTISKMHQKHRTDDSTCSLYLMTKLRLIWALPQRSLVLLACVL